MKQTNAFIINGMNIDYSYDTIDEKTGTKTASNTHDGCMVLPTETEIVNAINTINNYINNRLNPVVPVQQGSITIKYVNSVSGTDLITPTVMSGLVLATYVLNSKDIPNYNLIDSSTKTVILDSNNIDVVIEFKYTPIILGSITIRYEDETNTEITNADNYTNLNMGNYTYQSKTFTGYTINDDISKMVSLTVDSPNKEIIFKYIKEEGTV